MTKSATYKVHIDDYGNQSWLKYDPENPNPQVEIFHNEHGPAYVGISGYKQWQINDKLNRLDGPAVEYSDGFVGYYIDGVYYHTKEEYDKKVEEILNPVKKMTIEEIQEKLGHKIEIVESKLK